MTGQANITAANFLQTLEQLRTHLNQLEATIAQMRPPSGHGAKPLVDAQFKIAVLQNDLLSLQEDAQQASLMVQPLEELVRISALITSSLVLEELLKGVMDSVIKLTHAERAYLMLRNENTNELVTRAARNFNEKTLSNEEIVYSRSIVEDAIRTGAPILIDSAQEHCLYKDRDSVIQWGLLSIVCMPLIFRDQVIGALYADNPFQKCAFRADLLPVLMAFGNQVAVAIENAQLFEHLQRSRARLVAAHEEERRRLGNALHDDLGARIGRWMFDLDFAREQLKANPAEADETLCSLIENFRDTSSTVREWAHSLRPPRLNQLGLVRALHEETAHLNRTTNVHVTFYPPRDDLVLSAAVEVAAYLIVQEAVANVMNHAGANTCKVSLAVVGNVLTVEIVDDGCGLPTAHTRGVGLVSMRERAEELGGTCCIENLPGQTTGTRVIAELPIS